MNDLRMHESGSEYVYELDVPTAEADTLVAEVRDACVTVSGGVDRDPEFFGKSGRKPSVFSRRIVLPTVGVRRVHVPSAAAHGGLAHGAGRHGPGRRVRAAWA